MRRLPLLYSKNCPVQPVSLFRLLLAMAASAGWNPGLAAKPIVIICSKQQEIRKRGSISPSSVQVPEGMKRPFTPRVTG